MILHISHQTSFLFLQQYVTVTPRGRWDISVTRWRASVRAGMERSGVSVRSASRVNGDFPTARRASVMGMQRAVILKQANATNAETTHQDSCVTGNIDCGNCYFKNLDL